MRALVLTLDLSRSATSVLPCANLTWRFHSRASARVNVPTSMRSSSSGRGGNGAQRRGPKRCMVSSQKRGRVEDGERLHGPARSRPPLRARGARPLSGDSPPSSLPREAPTPRGRRVAVLRHQHQAPVGVQRAAPPPSRVSNDLADATHAPRLLHLVHVEGHDPSLVQASVGNRAGPRARHPVLIAMIPADPRRRGCAQLPAEPAPRRASTPAMSGGSGASNERRSPVRGWTKARRAAWSAGRRRLFRASRASARGGGRASPSVGRVCPRRGGRSKPGGRGSGGCAPCGCAREGGRLRRRRPPRGSPSAPRAPRGAYGHLRRWTGSRPIGVAMVPALGAGMPRTRASYSFSTERPANWRARARWVSSSFGDHRAGRTCPCRADGRCRGAALPPLRKGPARARGGR